MQQHLPAALGGIGEDMNTGEPVSSDDECVRGFENPREKNSRRSRYTPAAVVATFMQCEERELQSPLRSWGEDDELPRKVRMAAMLTNLSME
jgi:hypothetical protein